MARPREFNVDTALERAMDVFWSKGYEATSLDDLCEVTGLSRSSFYATFGSKRSLLLRSVDRYVEQRNPKLAAILAQPLPIRDAFAALAQQFIDQIVSGPGRRGCFLGNCAAELPRSDRAALARVRQGLESTEATFRDALTRATVPWRPSGRCRRECAGPLPHVWIPGVASGRQGEPRPRDPRRHRGHHAAMP